MSSEKKPEPSVSPSDEGAPTVTEAYVTSPSDPSVDPEKAYRYVNDNGNLMLDGVSCFSQKTKLISEENGEIVGGVKRTLKERHMAMIALGGAIGTSRLAIRHLRTC